MLTRNFMIEHVVGGNGDQMMLFANMRIVHGCLSRLSAKVLGKCCRFLGSHNSGAFDQEISQ